MRHIENIIIGTPIVPWSTLVCSEQNINEIEQELEKTFFTQERNISKILKEIGIVNSISEIRRNKPDLCKDFKNLDCFWIKWGKNRFWVVVGE